MWGFLEYFVIVVPARFQVRSFQWRADMDEEVGRTVTSQWFMRATLKAIAVVLG